MDDEEYLAISAIEHFVFCPRQVYLIHSEGQFASNASTIEGDHLHQRVNDGEDESRPGVRICRSLHLVNHRLGVRGIADVVEFHGGMPVPVEFKRGGGKSRACQQVQVVVQALCLEEMLGVEIARGFIWRGATRRREVVGIDAAARQNAETAIAATRRCLAQSKAPQAVQDLRCEQCSLKSLCLPAATAGRSWSGWLTDRVGR